MKIVIFGGRGFIGQALGKKARESYEVVIFDLPENDVERPETFTAQLISEKPDVVINLAGIFGGVKESPPVQKLFETNVMGNLNILKAAYDAGAKNYIFLSSMAAHGENKPGEHQKRFSLFNPQSGYQASKAAAEYSMQQFLREAPDMKIITLRATMVLAKGTQLQHAPIDFIKTILAGKDIEIYGEGRHEREWVWVDDVADGILRAIEYATGTNPGYYPFFLSSSRVSMRDLAEKIVSKMGGKVVFTPSTKQAFTLTSDIEESQSALGWVPKYDMDMMIDKLIDAFKA